ncbi:MAG: hypothetical protein ACRETL_10975 [Gammaproteobacteria bacterium]
MPKQSGALPAAQVAQVAASVNTVGKLATNVDKAGDKNDKAGVVSAFKALQDGFLRRLMGETTNRGKSTLHNEHGAHLADFCAARTGH